MTDALPAFPSRQVPFPSLPLSTAQADIGLRRAVMEDLVFLRKLYGQARREELEAAPWPPALRRQFLDDQFALQHRHYVQHFDQADFLIVTRASSPIGRLYVQISPHVHLIDISLVEDERGKGLGSALIGALQEHARDRGLDVRLHVAPENAGAKRLYHRLGFLPLPADGHYLPMRWTPSQLNTA